MLRALKAVGLCVLISMGYDEVLAEPLRIHDDAQALQYCQLNPNTYVALLYPCVSWDFAKVKSIFAKYGALLYEKKLVLTDNGPFNILRVSYAQEPWIGGFYNDFKGIKFCRSKRYPHFAHHKLYKVIALLFECESLQKVLTCKKEIRGLIKKSPPYPIHINDTHSETIDLAQVVFHDGSITFLNGSKRAQFKRFDQLLAEYKKILSDSGANVEDFCIVGSAVQAAWGLRECSDLFFIHLGHDHFEKQSHAKGVMRSLNLTPFYRDSKKRDEIIHNPAKHFYHQNVKFAIE